MSIWDKYSLIENVGMQENYRCGYCQSKDTNVSYGIWAHIMTVFDYQALLNRGWRRSGKYCYKPQMDKICCPTYTIKCEACQFKLSKSHKKVLKHMESFLKTGKIEMSLSNDVKLSVEEKSHATNDLPLKSHKSYKPGLGADPNKPKCTKKKLLKAKKIEDKLLSSNLNCELHDDQKGTKTLEDYLVLSQLSWRHTLKLKLCHSNVEDKEFLEDFDTSYKLYRKYQSIIHKDGPDENKRSQYSRFLGDTPLVVQKFPVDKIKDLESFKDLQDIPVPTSYGSYHCQYWLDECSLIAVGVLDVLPNCISSKYFYYDPYFSHLSLGVYSALIELAMVRKLNRVLPDLKYYYMGYYIHSCPKMRYKARYGPAYLLCPERFTWVPVKKCLPKLDVNPYTVLDDTRSAIAEKDAQFNNASLGSVLTLYNRTIMVFKDFLFRKKGLRLPENALQSSNKELLEDLKELKTYALLVGFELCHNSLVLYRN